MRHQQPGEKERERVRGPRMADGPGGENMKREREKRQIEKSKRENRNEG